MEDNERVLNEISELIDKMNKPHDDMETDLQSIKNSTEFMATALKLLLEAKKCESESLDRIESNFEEIKAKLRKRREIQENSLSSES